MYSIETTSLRCNGKLKEESNWENDDLITGSVRNFDEDGKLT